MLNAAIYGLGGFGKRLVEAVQGSSEKMRVVKGISRDPAQLAQYGAEQGFPIVATLDEALADPAVQAVIVATPHSLHGEHVRRIAMAGKHVICEKPFTLTHASAVETVKTARDRKIVLAVSFNRRFRPAVIELRRIVAAGEIGQVMHLEGQFSGGPVVPRTATSWRGTRAENPGGSMGARGIHILDGMISMVGPVRSLLAQSSRRVVAVEHDDTTSMLLRFGNGVTGYLGTIAVGPDFWRLHVFGTTGWAEVRGEHTLTVCKAGGQPVVTEYPPTDTLKDSLEAFADAVAGGKPHPVSLEDAINSSAVLEAVGKCRQDGGWMAIATD